MKTDEELKQQTDLLKNIYLNIKQTVIQKGFEKEINWVSNIPENFDKNYFFKEYSWVVINSGMRNTVAERIYQRFWKNSDIPDFKAIGHNKKRDSMMRVYKGLDRYFFRFTKSKNKLKFLQTIPFIGKITKYHLARNLGLDYAKPDRHLVKIAALFNYSNVQKFCEIISKAVNEKIGVVDLIIWRYATIFNDYIEKITQMVREIDPEWEEKPIRKRLCLKCENELKIEDYLNINRFKEIPNLIEIWESEIIELLCCRCYKKELMKDENYVEKSDQEILSLIQEQLRRGIISRLMPNHKNKQNKQIFILPTTKKTHKRQLTQLSLRNYSKEIDLNEDSTKKKKNML
jgi:hypothetical protein